MPESTPVPVCPIHATFMVPYTPACESVKGATCFRCSNLDCPLVYLYGESEGYYKLEASGELKRYDRSALFAVIFADVAKHPVKWHTPPFALAGHRFGPSESSAKSYSVLNAVRK